MAITLTKAEDQLCTLLDQCTRVLKESQGLETSCRIAGGWVRDKLLGSQCNDIDIALENMMGVTFAEHFVAYCRNEKHLAVKAVAKIESNPDQSKHLETARTTILGIELDFVNLRSEEYSENSRIPTQVTFGTPLQDALRRDITINTLFYNVHSRSVEDHTGKGLDDLKKGIVRTPLSPRETFTDDPLRVLRCVRFASRFGFEMVPELREAAKDPVILEALRTKISRERIAEELDKMMGGRYPLLSIQLLHDLSLLGVIFSIPDGVDVRLSASPASPDVALSAATILHSLTARSLPPDSGDPAALPNLHPLFSSALKEQTDALRRLYLASALTPYHGLTYTHTKGKVRPAVEAVLRDGLKLGVQHHYLDGIPALFAAADLLQKGVADWEQNSFDRPERVFLGLLIRDKTVHNPVTGSHWVISLLFALTHELTGLRASSPDSFEEASAKRITAYNALISRIEALDLSAAADAKPILDGREVVRAFGEGVKPGQWTGQVLSRVVEWQLERPAGTKEECEAWLREERAADRIAFDAANVPSKRDGGRGGDDGKAKKAKKGAA